MTGTRSWRRAAGALTVGLLAALVAAGCGSSSDDAGSSTAEQATPPEAAGDKAAGGTAQDGGAAQTGGNTPAKAPDKLPPDERSIINTGTITVEPDNVNTAADSAVSIARTAGGLVGGDNRSVTETRAEARVTLRVPADKFTSVVGDLAKLGKETGREIKTEDVTEQVVDVTSRIATAQASVERVRALLARATALGEIVSLEAEVAKREAELESLKARLNKLTSLTAMSTITAVFVKDTSGKATPSDKDPSGFLAGLSSGWNSFTDSLQVLLTVLGALLPWFLALGLPALLLMAVLRRTAARRTPLPGTPFTGSPLTGTPASAPAAASADD
jgi:hypothetical protein